MARANRLLINTVETCVDEMLQGIVDGNPEQNLIEGHRVIIRRDVKKLQDEGKVTIICGGGSGHEPFSGGFVGKGMLTAAVAGSVFASPPPNDILAALKAVTSPGGTLVIVANYTGDRLNFGIACERAAALGIKASMIVVGEDCALQSSDKTAGRRGLVGIINVMKIAGAMSDLGKSLEEITQVCSNVVKSMGTIGVSVSASSVPGSGASFDLPETEMEIGLGAHGEAGVKRVKLLPADKTVEALIDHMTDPNNPSHLQINAGESVSLIMNNLGGLSELEMHVLSRRAIEYIESKEIQVSRFLFGHFMTSLDMAGFNMNILRLNEDLVSYLDAETSVPGWPNIRNPKDRRTKPKMKLDTGTESHSSAQARLEQGSQEEMCKHVRNAVLCACEALIANETYLNDLDRGAGDGDCGATLKRGANYIMSRMSNLKTNTVAEILQYIAVCAENSMGGASGGIYSLLFTAASNNLKDPSSIKSWSVAVQCGINAVSRYGGAEPGDRTMLDALVAIQKSLDLNEENDKREILAKAAKSASDAAEATAGMPARAGRASYVSKDQLTKPDAGAAAVAVWMKAVSNS